MVRGVFVLICYEGEFSTKLCPMNPRTQKWKIAAVIVLPAFVGWISLVFVFVARAWIRNFSVAWLIDPLFAIALLMVLPLSGFWMGVLNVVLRRVFYSLSGNDHRLNNGCLWLYYLPLIPVGVLSYGLLILPAFFHIICYLNGQQFGLKWLDEGLFEEFFDLPPHPSSSTKS